MHVVWVELKMHVVWVELKNACCVGGVKMHVM